MEIIPQLNMGDRAPDTNILDENGQTVKLSAVWQQGKPVLLTFLRHFG